MHNIQTGQFYQLLASFQRSVQSQLLTCNIERDKNSAHVITLYVDGIYVEMGCDEQQKAWDELSIEDADLKFDFVYIDKYYY